MQCDNRITSTANPRIKALVWLRRRGPSVPPAQILIDGHREISRAMEAGIVIGEVFYCPSLIGADIREATLKPAKRLGAQLIEVNEAVFAKIGYGDRAEGAVAVAQRPERTLADLRLGHKPLLAVVECVEKPGNLGALLRSADAAGIEAVIAADPVTDVYHSNVIRSSLGTVFSVPLVEARTIETIEWLNGRRISVVAASPAGKTVYTDVDLTGPVAIVFGSEAQGLTEAWNRTEVTPAVVPMLGRADSLNVSITAALFFYEALRQRRRRKR